ncbi:hypothetical protein [Pseudothauera rhizosphaerae]|uniref:Uncharacterized protein n=1 Tax=Pseudothauera rhizosphaerae TaxID=2565932 RepID=A0A4S4AK62_9RHOO|nr:hypothetical protein [Pseudothauera rhizosphaerae]THF59399.1 hypothetical protein E6O51_15515 [Pseudothauera rhizosphaerae]
MKKSKLKPRNPLVAQVRRRGGGGVHEESFKARRSREKAALRREVMGGRGGEGREAGRKRIAVVAVGFRPVFRSAVQEPYLTVQP